MAEASKLTQHIESYVNVESSGAPAQQAASLDAIYSLLKNDLLTLEALVREMGLYLTTTDHIIRARGILLLAEVLTFLSSKPLDKATIHSLIIFFMERLADWRALRGALVGCLALMRRKEHVGRVTVADAKALAEAYVQYLHVQSLGQEDRKLCFELLECLLENYSDAVIPLGNDVVDAICEAIDAEKDPQCLMLTFHIVEVVAQLFPDPNGPLASIAEDLFDMLGRYFPIHFTHQKGEDLDIKRHDLSRALMQAFSSTAFFEPFAVPLLLEKLSSDLPSAKVDSLKYLGYCSSRYGPDRMEKHAKSIWPLLKHAIFSAPLESVMSFCSESLDHMGSSKDEIVDEALTVLEKVIAQNNNVYLNLIVGDEEVNLVMDKISSYKSYAEISKEGKQKLHGIGCVISVSAKTCTASCNRIFERFFPDLLESLGLDMTSNPSGSHALVDEYVVPEKINFGALFVSVVFLETSRDLITGFEMPTTGHISASDACWCMLHRFSALLTKVFTSILRRNNYWETSDADTCLAVKGLQILATFPGDFLPIEKSLFEEILKTFMSVITENFKNTFLWKLALKALVKVGLYIEKSHQSEKASSFMVIVVEKMRSLLTSAESSVPYSLKLEAISDVGMSGVNYMQKIIEGIEGALFTNFFKLHIHGNTMSAENTVQLLECYSKKVLPWMHESGGSEEVILQFVVNLLNQIGDCKDFIAWIDEKEIDATMTAVKLAVAICSETSQNIIIQKAYSVLSSSPFFSSTKSFFDACPTEMESLPVICDMESMSAQDVWALSLFASVIIALRPTTHLPNINVIVRLLLRTLLMGHLPSAQALGSVVNKLYSHPSGETTSGDYSLEEAVDVILGTSLKQSTGSLQRCSEFSGRHKIGLRMCLGGSTNRTLQINAIVGFAWIGKGLLMRGHEKVKDITMAFLECLLPSDGEPSKQASLEDNWEQYADSSGMKCAADAFHILISDSEICLNRRFHTIIRPLYKQKFFSTMMPILQSLIMRCDSSFTRSLLYRVFTYVICETPLVAVLGEARQLIPLLLNALLMFSRDNLDKDLMYSLLLVLSSILTDRKREESVNENAHIIISCLVQIISYPHMMLVRETALQCLVAMSTLPHARIYPMKNQVLKAVSGVLDDPKRAVRQEAAKCRQAWLAC